MRRTRQISINGRGQFNGKRYTFTGEIPPELRIPHRVQGPGCDPNHIFPSKACALQYARDKMRELRRTGFNLARKARIEITEDLVEWHANGRTLRWRVLEY